MMAVTRIGILMRRFVQYDDDICVLSNRNGAMYRVTDHESPMHDQMNVTMFY